MQLEKITTIVTGAGGGLGRALSIRLAEAGVHLALIDINQSALQETRFKITQRCITTGTVTPEITLHKIDIAEKNSVRRGINQIAKQHATPALLINNAGVAHAGPFIDSPERDFDRVLRTNLHGTIAMTRACLPLLIRRPEAMICNILSDFALLGFPGKSAYAASKFGLRGFMESLALELNSTSVRICNVYPGPLDTDLIRASTTTDADRLRREADFVRLKAIPMERVTNRIIRAIQSNATRVRIGRETYLIDWALRLFPRWTYTLLARFMHKIDFV
ncbi:MAG: SDR family oxidoreductase [Leptospiraceae bacterium]|nr:SDR family oxidoreductase [Leptospiraceae bacterium]